MSHMSYGGQQFYFGWEKDEKSTEAYISSLAEPEVYNAAPHLKGYGEGKDVLYWEIEEKVLGKQLPVWNQSSIGSCVSHGGGRSAQDLLLIQIAAGEREQWEGHEIAREPIYGGSRCNVGRWYGSYQDGSTGAFCSEWLSRVGGLIVYGPRGLDGTYNVSRCREWGAKGVSKEYVEKAQEHKLKSALVTSVEQIRDCLAAGKPINVCGTISRTMKRQKNGYCPKTGNNWAHSQELCGTCVVKGNVPSVAYRNSWGEYLGEDNNRVTLESGREIILPDGVYLARLEELAEELRQRDTFTYSGANGWKISVIPWLI
jgi:hypothetical protein